LLLINQAIYYSGAETSRGKGPKRQGADFSIGADLVWGRNVLFPSLHGHWSWPVDDDYKMNYEGLPQILFIFGMHVCYVKAHVKFAFLCHQFIIDSYVPLYSSKLIPLLLLPQRNIRLIFFFHIWRKNHFLFNLQQ
jgi:hypothetical protein